MKQISVDEEFMKTNVDNVQENNLSLHSISLFPFSKLKITLLFLF